MTSKIKVDNIADQNDNNIINESGDVITVGAAGDTVAVAGNIVKSNALQASDGGNIASQSGTTITLGASGDTVSLASGASQSGFGRTGTVDWQTAIKTSTITVVSGEGYFVNTTGGAITANLPAGSAGAIAAFRDYANTFDSNALTISSNGSEKINGDTLDLSVDTEGESVTLVYADATKGWLVVNDGNNDAGSQAQFVAATGGTITTVCTDYKVHTFTGPGTFCVSSAGNATGSNTIDYLVMAGGGGGGDGSGGSSSSGGGGGAGGYRESPGTASGSYTASPRGTAPAVALPVAVAGYPVAIGAGGATNSSGSNSVFTGTTTITSTGGGRGGNGAGGAVAGTPGGSGGGSNGSGGAGGTGNTPPVNPPQGSDGGSSPGPQGGAGGGGALGNGASVAGGGGGNVATSSINGSATPRAKGGDGAAPGGGGGAGTPQADNSGFGGPGGKYPGGAGGTGGSGIVIIRYKFQ